jgi:2-methylcitrate dehydratase PrpD
MVAEMVKESSFKEQCSVFGQKWRTSRSGAALLNGVMVGAFESEHADPVGVHPGGNVFPALLAAAEPERVSGKEFLTAMVVGYEVAVRIGEAATRAVEDERGFHGPSINGPFGAAVAAGKILGLGEADLVNALGIAGSHCSGLLEFKWEGAMTKRLHLGRGGQMGLESALLAQKGFTGPSTILEGPHGFLNVYSLPDRVRVERLTEGLGTIWLGKDRQLIKPFSCHGTQLHIVEALLKFKREHNIDINEINKISIVGDHHMRHTHENRQAESVMAMQYSMPFTVAISLLYNIADPYVLTERVLWDPKVRALAACVDTLEDSSFEPTDDCSEPRGQILIELEGTSYVIDARGYKGLPGNPFTFEEMAEKFRAYSEPVVGETKAKTIIEKVKDLEYLLDIGELANLIRVLCSIWVTMGFCDTGSLQMQRSVIYRYA